MARGQFNTDDELSNYYAKIYAQLENETLSDPYGNYILQRIKGGQKTVFNKTQSEIRNFDMSFLDTIESVYPAILKIMRDPKRSLRYEEEIVAVEKAKKVNSQTVRHLSSHTHLIKEITKDDDVIPSKVLTTFAEEELATYENRFIKSLVKRMEMFLERRYEVMKVSLESFETERLNVANKFLMSGQEVTVSLDIAIKNDLTTNVETTKEQYNRLLYIREMVQGLKGTEFMRTLAKARDVLPPIMKTNIILHNPDFKLCYGLWLYLDRVDGIATNIDIREKSYRYSNIFDKDINEVMAIALTAFIKNRGIDGIYASKKLPQVKAPKPQTNEELELELNLEADNKKLEDYTMNELLLSQTAKFFEASMDGMQRTGNNYSESVRVVYRQMLDMLDQIYPKAFGVSDEELESKDLYEQLEYARRKMMILKVVRQQKQMNIARMGKEEKRIEKLQAKLEEKIKVQEQREREREERERAKEEAKRLAALEKKRAEQARKKRLENEALTKQKAIEKAKIEAQNANREVSEEKMREHERMAKPAEAARNYLRQMKEAEERKALEAEKAVMPIRRKDEYDDLSDEELALLMAENELLGLDTKEPKKKEEPKEEAKPAPKKKKKPAPKAQDAKPEPERPAPKKVKENVDIEDMTDDELEALLAANGMFGDSGVGFSTRDLDSTDDEPVEEVKPEPKKKSKKDKNKDAAITKAKPKEEPKEEAPVEENFDDMSDEELEQLLAMNDIESDDIPRDEPQVVEEAPAEDAQYEELDVDSMTPEELEALMTNDINNNLDELPQE
ncbi:MAG: DUF2357 domain-containing protein, partial [Acholeplasmatales bacterium]|nr:DUF2357 domain-containing protein [Acholeplasmatales bacterium]